jgi:hypothetical protein
LNCSDLGITSSLRVPVGQSRPPGRRVFWGGRGRPLGVRAFGLVLLDVVTNPEEISLPPKGT